MAAEWAKRRGLRLFAATVDHGLRPGSAAEAESVARLSAKLGVPHATLLWTRGEARARVQERAREARYRLLAAHAAAVGAEAVATAHHLDDQAETVLFRLIRGSGVAGLAGMAPPRRLGPVALLRPLLGVPKADLVGFWRLAGLARRGPVQFRPVLRAHAHGALLERLAAEGLDAEGFARLARRMREADAAIEARPTRSRPGSGDVDRRDPALRRARRDRPPRSRPPRLGGRRPGDRPHRAREDRGPGGGPRGGRRRGEGPFAANVGGALVRLDGRGRLHVLPEPPRRGGA